MIAKRIPKIDRGNPFELQVDGVSLPAYHGETIATALMAAGIRKFHENRTGKHPNRLYCGMGVCLQCLVTIERVGNVRACETLAQPGMIIETR